MFCEFSLLVLYLQSVGQGAPAVPKKQSPTRKAAWYVCALEYLSWQSTEL